MDPYRHTYFSKKNENNQSNQRSRIPTYESSLIISGLRNIGGIGTVSRTTVETIDSVNVAGYHAYAPNTRVFRKSYLHRFLRMLWCLPTPNFLKKTTSTPLKISAPILAGSERMYARRHPTDDASESGIFYLVPNRHGPGKNIVKRPRPPPTSPPLDDDFDAITHGGTTTKTPETELFSQPQRSEQTRATSPYDIIEDHKRSASSPEPHVAKKQEPRWRPSSPAESFIGRTPNLSQRRKGKARDDGFERYGEYESYMTEMEKMFGGRGDMDLSVKLLGAEPNRESYQLGRVKSSGTARSRRAIVGSRLPNGELPGSVEDHGPKAGQTYEVVNRQVVEDGPDRTVTIATWREQVAREAKPNVDTMSVYYVNAEDYARDDVEEYVDGTKTEVETYVARGLSGGEVSEVRREGSPAPLYVTDRNSLEQAPETPILSSIQPRVRPPTPPQKDWHGPLYTEHTHTRDGTALLQQRSHRIPPRSLTPDRLSQSGTISSIRSPAERQTTGSYGMTPPSPPRTSTPVQSSLSSSRHIESEPHESTPIAGRMPNSPFHPTASGSTISSIKSSSSIAFERILESCQPSIVHIAPILAGLGITSEEHLRAVARLSSDTRDREVKDEALKLGVTVMEWAILVDRLLSL